MARHAFIATSGQRAGKGKIKTLMIILMKKKIGQSKIVPQQGEAQQDEIKIKKKKKKKKQREVKIKVSASRQIQLRGELLLKVKLLQVKEVEL